MPDGDTVPEGVTLDEATFDADRVGVVVDEGVIVGQTAATTLLSETEVPTGCEPAKTVPTVLPSEHTHGPTDVRPEYVG